MLIEDIAEGSAMDTRYLKTLHVVLECGSFSKAAGELFITQSAVSQRIRFMEDFYGSPLVVRSGGQSVHATEAGTIVNAKAVQIVALERELEQELKQLDNKKRLTLYSTPTFGVVYLPKVLNRFFLANSGNVDFKFALNTPDQLQKAIVDNECDIAVIEHCNALNVLEAETIELPPDELIFISAPSLGLPQPFIALEKLFTQRLIARRDGCSSRCLLQENLKKFGKNFDDFSGMIVHDDLHLTIETVLAGTGIAFVSKHLVQELVAGGELLSHTVEGFNVKRSRTVLVNSRRKDEPLIKQLLESIYTVFEAG